MELLIIIIHSDNSLLIQLNMSYISIGNHFNRYKGFIFRLFFYFFKNRKDSLTTKEMSNTKPLFYFS